MKIEARHARRPGRSARCSGASAILHAGLAAVVAASAVVVGCTVYQTAPGVYSSAPPPPQPSAFDRSWNAADAFPARAAGVFFSERFLEVWDTSRGQEGAQGILTNFLSGAQDESVAAERFRAGLAELSPAMAASIDDGKSIFMPWARQPFALGSYAGARVGQYTTILEQAAAPSSDGRVHFAGEHTSVDFMGFMNGAVESGERVASEILA